MTHKEKVSLTAESLPINTNRSEDKKLISVLKEADIAFIHKCPILVKYDEKNETWIADYFLPDFITVIDFYDDNYAYSYFSEKKRIVYHKNHFLFIPFLREKYLGIDELKATVINPISHNLLRKIRNLEKMQ